MSSLLPQYCQLDTHEEDSGCKWTRNARRTHLAGPQSFSSAPGEFHASLESLIEVSFAAADHAAVYQFDYTKTLERGSWVVDQRKAERERRANNMEPVLVFDYMTDLSNSGGGTPNSLRIETVDLPSTQGGKAQAITRIRSSATFSPSFGVGNFQVYTCLDVPLVRSSGVCQSTVSTPGATELTDIYDEAGVILTLDRDALAAAPYAGVLPVRMGISWVSTDSACAFAFDEIPAFPSTRSLTAVAAQTRTKWNRLLSDTLSVSHDGVSDDDLTLFYSSLYRSFLSPNNVTADNPRFSTTKPSFDSLYCIWDSARTIHPLWTLLAPKAQADVLQAIVEIQRHEGWLPDCRMSTSKGYTQGGSNAEMMLSDSYVKGILGDDVQFWQDALQAMLKDAQVEPASWGLVGRGGIAARAKLGYVPRGEWGSPSATGATPGRTASRTIEYAYNDFSIALVSAGLKRRDLYDTYTRLSNDTFNLWNTSIVSDGFSGFLQAREEDGTWAYQDPRRCSPHSNRWGASWTVARGMISTRRVVGSTLSSRRTTWRPSYRSWVDTNGTSSDTTTCGRPAMRISATSRISRRLLGQLCARRIQTYGRHSDRASARAVQHVHRRVTRQRRCGRHGELGRMDLSRLLPCCGDGGVFARNATAECVCCHQRHHGQDVQAENQGL